MHVEARRSRLEQELAGVLDGRTDSPSFRAPLRPGPETVPTGIAELDALIGGLPKGHITEITGTTSSGRTSLLLSVLAEISQKEEVIGLIDPGNAFDPASAAASGVVLEHLLWVRAAGKDTRQILKIADLLLQGGGFGLIGVDLSDMPFAELRRIPTSSWFRLQRAAEDTPTILLVLAHESILKTTAALALRTDSVHRDWSGHFLREVCSGTEVIRSRYAPSVCHETRPFRLRPTSVIASGSLERSDTSEES